jgi:hypothetical protein
MPYTFWGWKFFLSHVYICIDMPCTFWGWISILIYTYIYIFFTFQPTYAKKKKKTKTILTFNKRCMVFDLRPCKALKNTPGVFWEHLIHIVFASSKTRGSFTTQEASWK